jgi:cytochrome b561
MENTPVDIPLEASPHGARYTRTAIALHWLLAIAILYQLGLGVWMEGIPKIPPGLRAEWFNWHKSMGMVFGLLIVMRGIWRLTHRPPELPESLPRWQTWAASANHTLMYACMLAMPLSGFLGSSFTAYPIKFFGTPLPRLWEASADMKVVLGTVHTACSYAFMLAIAVHILAAVWHGLRRHGVLQRMLP